MVTTHKYPVCDLCIATKFIIKLHHSEISVLISVLIE